VEVRLLGEGEDEDGVTKSLGSVVVVSSSAATVSPARASALRLEVDRDADGLGDGAGELVPVDEAVDRRGLRRTLLTAAPALNMKLSSFRRPWNVGGERRSSAVSVVIFLLG
jgi:hypothetical protein